MFCGALLLLAGAQADSASAAAMAESEMAFGWNFTIFSHFYGIMARPRCNKACHRGRGSAMAALCLASLQC